MAVPADTKIFEEELDPYDVLDFEVNVAPLLENGESITSYSLTVPAESSLFGLEVKTTGGYATSMNANVIKFYLGITLAEQEGTSFSGSGLTLPLEVSITTNSNPPRKKQRTIAVKVRQR